jgi:uncharacterized Tic20 family protein
MSVAEELDKLKKLLDDGTITDEQYERARAKLLEKQQDEQNEQAKETREEPADKDEREERETRSRKKRKALRRYRDRDEDYDDDDDDDDYARRRSRRRRRRKETREWCMFLHLSLFAGHAVPLGGIIAPIIIWQVQKEKMPEIDEHGKNAVNWIISSILYTLICIPLCFVGVGFVLLIVLAVLHMVFPIIAAMKANEGRVWQYPLAIPFLS